jgi:hypothetical protein
MEFDRDLFLKSDGLQRRLLAESAARDLLPERDLAALKKWDVLREEFDRRYGDSNPEEVEDELFQERAKLCPDGFRALGKLARIEDKILEAGKG